MNQLNFRFLMLVALPLAAQPPSSPWASPTTFEPQSLEQKFMAFSVATYGPRALFDPVLGAAIRLAKPRDTYPSEWQHGIGAFGRNYGDGLARKSALETARFATSALLREDFRYRPSKAKNPMVRTAYAIGFTFVDRSDSGKSQLAVSNFAGAAASGFVGSLYMPRGFDDVSHAGTRTAFAFGEFALQNLLREFAPEIGKVAKKLHVPMTPVPIPEWWVKRK